MNVANANTRTNDLHKNLTVELRKEVERALVEQPPECPTYRQVHEKFRLAEHDVSIKSVEKYGRYLRQLARNNELKALLPAIAKGEDLSDETGAILQQLVLLGCTADEIRPGDILKLTMSLKNVQDVNIARIKEQIESEKLGEFKRKVQERIDAGKAAVERELTKHEGIPADVVDRVRELYGVVDD